jgi:hypothetical protein
MKLLRSLLPCALLFTFSATANAELLAEISFAAEGTGIGQPPASLPMQFTLGDPDDTIVRPRTFSRDIGLADVGVPFEVDDFNLVSRFRWGLTLYTASIFDQSASLRLEDLLENGWPHGSVNLLIPGLYDDVPLPSHLPSRVTLTADHLTIEPLSENTWSWSGAQTVRVYGEKVPEFFFPNPDPNPIVVNDNLLFGSSPGSFGLNLSKNVSRTGDPYTEIGFAFDGSTIERVNTVTLDLGAEYYIVRPGDVFSDQTIANGQFPLLHSSDSGATDNLPIHVGTDDFYIGIRTGLLPPFASSTGKWDVFGWVHVKPENGTLTMVGNVMSYNTRGIIIGTTTVVPEPCLGILVVGGVAPFLMLCRRR